MNSSDKTVVAPRLPRAIGRYEITGRLGKGAMGVVYSARDGMMERTVAIKMMMTDLEDDPETSSRFYREARSAGQLVHPNIVTIFDMGQENGRPYIVMEYLEGETLNKFVARPEAADIEVKIDLMIQICQGLNAAHSHGIYHRDIKPGNLLVRPNGELKIVDFGIARLASSSMTASGLIMGTPDYMSPEQARGEEIDQRSDIFSTGAVFYYILTGRKPFAAPDLAAVLLKVQREDPLPIRDSEAPPTLARIVMKALAKDPAGRYQTCGRMASELEHLKRDLQSQAIQQLSDADRRIAALEPIATERRTLIARLGIRPAPPDIEPARIALADRHAAIAEPLRRNVVAALLGSVAALEEPSIAEVTKWRAAAQAFDAGTQAMAKGRARDAVEQLEEALRIEPAAASVSGEMDRCRSLVAEQRSNSDRAAALLDEARKAAAAGHWQVAIGFCDDAIELGAADADLSALREQARAAIADEARQQRAIVERALALADVHRVNGRFSEAALAIARAREADPGASDIELADAKLKASIAEGERNAELARQSADAMAAARRQFAAGQREEAIAALLAFHGATGEAAAATEISRMQAEARRLAEAEQRAAEAASLAAQAEDALKAGDPQRALELGTRVLAIDPAHVLARKISGLAGGELKQRAEARARAAAAAENLEEARRQLARGKFRKARALVSTAADLDPQSPEHKVVLAAIADEEARTEAAAERERVLKQRAKAVAPILELARAAEAKGDMERAVWLAENALALDLECTEARAMIQRVKAQIAANPKLADETVDLPGETGREVDPDDTASLIRPAAGLWERLTSVFRSRRSSDAGGRTASADGGSDSKGRT